MSLFSDNKISNSLLEAVRAVMTKKEVQPVDEMSKGMAYATGTKKAMQSTGDQPPLEKTTIKKAHKIAKAILRQEEVNAPSKANGGIAHNCATHVKHATYGEGRCIPEMHTIVETEDGEGYVTHYDIMFNGEQGPFIKEDVPVEELEIISEKKHKHMKEDIEAVDEAKMKKDKGDMDKDGVHEPDDKEYMDNKDKAIKAAMAKKKG